MADTKDLPLNSPQKHAKWQTLVQEVLALAKSKGATAAEADASSQNGLSVTVRLGDVETLEYHRDQGLVITVYFGQRKGSASSSDLSPAALLATVEAACNIAKATDEDPCAGLADPQLLAKSWSELDLYHPWNISPEEVIHLAKECETIGRNEDKRITNSEGASVSTHEGIYYYGNSEGFLGGYPTTRHSLSCALVASEKNDMERDYSFTVARNHRDLFSAERVAKDAAMRTVRRLGARKLSTRQAPVIFEAEIAASLLGNFVSAIRGGNLYRKCSFLLDHLGKPVFSPHVNIFQRPHLPKAMGSAPFDNEGVATSDLDFVKDGILQHYVLSTYSARKLGMQSTGNAGGVYNLFIKPGPLDKEGLLKKMDTGLLVTELMGQGVNIITGDYSRGVAGFWVEGGVIQYPVHEITIAGNLRDMFLHLVAVGHDIDRRSNICSGSILLEKMTIGGE